ASRRTPRSAAGRSRSFEALFGEPADDVLVEQLADRGGAQQRAVLGLAHPLVLIQVPGAKLDFERAGVVASLTRRPADAGDVRGGDRPAVHDTSARSKTVSITRFAK